MDKQTIGKLGEDLAAKFLANQGYRIIYRNYRAKQYGEVDIIALSPDKKTLVFVEVKTRVGDQFGNPEDAITFFKLRELKRMVDYFFNQNPQFDYSPQIDVIAISIALDYTVQSLNHFENVTL